jgi:surfactin synthase thioesterase subunit
MTDRPTTLVCLPFAGAGASFFRPWQLAAPAGLTVVPLQLPGRERRIEDPPYHSVTAAADDLVTDIDALGTLDRVVLFGHSLGAVLAYELARRLAGTDGGRLAGLVVSGSPGPWTRRDRRATGLPDDEFVRRVSEFAGYAHAALADPEMRELILPTLRADVAMHEDYAAADDTPLPVPIVSVRGDDDQLVTADEAGQWSKATSQDFTLVTVPGGHMYLTESATPVLRLAGAL